MEVLDKLFLKNRQNYLYLELYSLIKGVEFFFQRLKYSVAVFLKF